MARVTFSSNWDGRPRSAAIARPRRTARSCGIPARGAGPCRADSAKSRPRVALDNVSGKRACRTGTQPRCGALSAPVGSGWCRPGRVSFDSESADAWVRRPSISPISRCYISADAGRRYIHLAVSQESTCRYCYAETRSVMKILASAKRIRRLKKYAGCCHRRKRGRETLRARCACKPQRRAAMGGRCSRPATSGGRGCGGECARPPVDAGGSRPRVWRGGGRATRYMRLFRPMVARMVRPRTTAHVERLRPEQRVGPFAAFVNALDGQPGRGTPARRKKQSTRRGARRPCRCEGVDLRRRRTGQGVRDRRRVQMLADEGMSASDVTGALARSSGATLWRLKLRGAGAGARV